MKLLKSYSTYGMEFRLVQASLLSPYKVQSYFEGNKWVTESEHDDIYVANRAFYARIKHLLDSPQNEAIERATAVTNGG